MINFDKLSASRKKQESALLKRKSREEEALSARHRQEKTEVSQRYRSLEQEIADKYYLGAAGVVLTQLEADRDLMESRSKFVNVTDADREVAKQLKEALDGIEDEKSREKMIALVESTSKDTPNLRPALEMLSREDIGSMTITSYMAAQKTNGHQIAYLVTPIPEVGKSHLSNDLEFRLMERLERGEAILGLTGALGPRQIVVAAAAGTIEFKHKDKSAQGFHYYEIDTSNNPNDAITPLANCLTKELSELQPENFARVKLTHRVINMDEPEILKALVERKRAELYADKTKLAELLEKGVKYITLNEGAEITGKSRDTLYHWARAHSHTNSEGKVSVEALLAYGERTKGAEYKAKETTLAPRENYASSPGQAKSIRPTEDTEKIEQLRQLARDRLASIVGERLNSYEIAEVLEMSHTSAATLGKKMSSGDTKAEMRWSRERQDGKYYIAREYIEQFIGTAVPTKSGWEISKRM